jgi:UDP-N-acetylmuramate dehydrogenase
MQVHKNFDLRHHNSFGLAAKCAYFVRIDDATEIPQALDMATHLGKPMLVLGGGSNMLFTRDFEGTVLQMAIPGIEIESETAAEVIVNVGAGVNWHELVLWAVARGYGGLENLSLIPGTVGAAPIQNIGAYGVELKDVFYKLRGYHFDKGFMEFDSKACGFGYRQSIFKGELKGKFMVSAVYFRLQKNPALKTTYGAIQEELEKLDKTAYTIGDISTVVCRIRQSKLPDPSTIGNAGSFFKNPELEENVFARLKISYPDMPGYPAKPGYTKISAAWLIEQCGWKGKVVGHTGTYARHALVLVNHGGASGPEIWALAKDIIGSVFDKFGLQLEPEVNIIG